MSNVPNVQNETLRKLTDVLLSCLVTNTGDYLRPAPYAFNDTNHNPVVPNGSEVRFKIKSSPEGAYASAIITCINTNGAEDASGQLDLDKLATLISFTE